MSDQATFLVPVDLSDCTSDVVQRAAQLAQVNGAQVVVLHVVQTPTGVAADLELREGRETPTRQVGQALVDEARPTLDDHVEGLRTQGIDGRGRIVIGEPVEAILEAADELAPELIVMGTHGRSGLSRLLLGSVAEKVSRRAPCPVVTVKTRWRESCDARGCDWCDKHVSPGARSIAAEADG